MFETGPAGDEDSGARAVQPPGEEDDEAGGLTGRQPGPPCDCPLNCYSKIPVAYRRELLRTFWAMESELHRDAYLAECILFDEGFYTSPKPQPNEPVTAYNKARQQGGACV